MAQEVRKYCCVTGSTWSFQLCNQKLARFPLVQCQRFSSSVPLDFASWKAQAVLSFCLPPCGEIGPAVRSPYEFTQMNHPWILKEINNTVN